MFKTVIVICCLIFLPISGQAASKHFLSANTFNAAGQLKKDLQVEFTLGNSPDLTIKQLQTPNAEIFLAVVTQQRDTSLFLQHIFGGEVYNVYKVRLRDAEHEELVILAYDNSGKNKQLLKSVNIIGENEAGQLTTLKILNFEATEVMKMPLQLNEKNEIIMNLASNANELKIFWDSSKQNFVFKK